MIEEQHVTQYGALLDTTCTWLENLLLHEYTECYLYYSCMMDETDANVRKIWEEHFDQELSHLHCAAQLLQKYEGKEWQQVIPGGEFPQLLHFAPQKEYIRDVLAGTVRNTALREDPQFPVNRMPRNADFFKYQETVNHDVRQVASHCVIDATICAKGCDYRYEDCPNPVEALRCRTRDNTEVGRRPNA